MAINPALLIGTAKSAASLAKPVIAAGAIRSLSRGDSTNPLENIENNIYQRWGAGNTGTTAAEKALSRRLDRRYDRLSDWSQNIGEGNADTPIGKLVNNRLGQVSDRYTSKFGTDINAEKPNGWFTSGGDNGDGTGADGLNKDPAQEFLNTTWMKPGSIWSDENLQGNSQQNVRSLLDNFGTITLPDGTKINKYDNVLGKFFDDKTGTENILNDDGTISTVAKSPYGSRYSGYETSGLNSLQDWQDNAAGNITGNISSFRSALSTDETALDKALNEQYTAAARGELTAPGSQKYQALKDQMDINARDARTAMKKELGWGQKLNSGQQVLQTQDFERKLAADKNAALTDIQMKIAEQAPSWAIQNKSLLNDVSKMALEGSTTSGKLSLESTGQMLGAISNAGKQMTDNANLKLKEQQLALDAEMNKLKATMDNSQWENEYDMRRKDMVVDNAMQGINTFINGLGGIQDIINDKNKTTAEKQSAFMNWVQMLYSA